MKRNGKRALTRPTRRQALAMLGAASACFDPIQTLLNALVDGIVTNAQATAAPSSLPPRKYAFLCLQYGPNRWAFDQPLAPYGASVSAHPFIRTRFQPSTTAVAGEPVYGTIPITRNGTTVNMPWLWGCQIPTANGGMAPMQELLSHMLCLRGIDMSSDGHKLNRDRFQRPVTNAPSLMGSVADRSGTPVPAVATDYTSVDIFKSDRGFSQVSVATPPAGSAVNPLQGILGAFDRSGEAVLPRRAALDVAMKSALKSLGEYAQSRAPGAETLFVMRNEAERLLARGIGDAATFYAPALAKYQDLIRRALDWSASPVEGLNDKRVPFDAFMTAPFASAATRIDEHQFTQSPDLRTMLSPDVTIPGLAEGFAIAEYLLTRNLSSAVSWGANQMLGIAHSNIVTDNGSTPSASFPVYTFDEHYTGTLVAMLGDGLLYRAVAACLYEFMSSLRAASLFQDTVIQVAGDFARTPTGMDGTYHGWQGSVTSLISGAIEQPLVLGNIYASENGTSGIAAPVLADGSLRALGMGQVASTVAELLRVESPTRNNNSLVSERAGGGIIPHIELARNVAG